MLAIQKEVILSIFFLSFSSALALEGIFRISGLASDVDKLVKQFEAAGMMLT